MNTNNPTSIIKDILVLIIGEEKASIFLKYFSVRVIILIIILVFFFWLCFKLSKKSKLSNVSDTFWGKDYKILAVHKIVKSNNTAGEQIQLPQEEWKNYINEQRVFWGLRTKIIPLTDDKLIVVININGFHNKGQEIWQNIYLNHNPYSLNDYNNGGRGGNAKVNGNYSTAIGGLGGGGGPFGKGGDGGNAEAIGDNCFAMGGEGGEAGQLDRGGRGGRSPFEILGHENIQLPDGSFLWDKGRGGDGAGPSIQDIQKRKFEENRKNFLDPRNSNK